MALATFDNYIGSAKQIVPWFKSAGRTTVANIWFSSFEVAGNPGGGTLAGASTTAGVVPTSATAGFPILTAFTGGANGYLGALDFGNSVASRIGLFDCLWKGGAYPFNASVTLSAQPSYLARTPDGAGLGCQIWLECVTPFTGNQSVAVTYTNSAGTTGRTTGTIATGVAPILGRMLQLPLQAGDSGLQKIESVTGTVASVGTFNVLVLRPLWSGRVVAANAGDTHGIDKVGLPIIFATSALYVAVAADSTALGIPELSIEVING